MKNTMSLAEFKEGKSCEIGWYFFVEPSVWLLTSATSSLNGMSEVDQWIEILTLFLKDKSKKEALKKELLEMTVSGMKMFTTQVKEWLGLEVGSN